MKRNAVVLVSICFFTSCHSRISMQERLYITDEMLKSNSLPYDAGDLVAKVHKIETNKESADLLRCLPSHWGTLEALMYYDMEVNNGGHKQYFINSRGYFIDLVENGLEHYGAKEHLLIYRQALSRYHAMHNGNDSNAINDINPYSDLDVLYYKSNPQLAKIIDKYIRDHIHDYRNNK